MSFVWVILSIAAYFISGMIFIIVIHIIDGDESIDTTNKYLKEAIIAWPAVLLYLTADFLVERLIKLSDYILRLFNILNWKR